MPRLYHLTINTGHLAVTSSVPQDILDRISAVVDAECGEIPGLSGWYLDILRPMSGDGRPIPGAAFFQIASEPGLSKMPAVMAMACWQPAAQAAAWQQAIMSYGALRASLIATRLWREPPRHPPTLPWLTVWLTPFIALAPPDIASALGDLERCVAWALMQ